MLLNVTSYSLKCYFRADCYLLLGPRGPSFTTHLEWILGPWPGGTILSYIWHGSWATRSRTIGPLASKSFQGFHFFVHLEWILGSWPPNPQASRARRFRRPLVGHQAAQGLTVLQFMCLISLSPPVLSLSMSLVSLPVCCLIILNVT